MKQKSFTLIELLVVIAIVGLLASVVLVSMTGVRDRARIARGLDFSKSVQHVLGAYAVAWWGFETIEAGNQVVDGSGHGNSGTVSGASLTEGVENNGSGTGNALSFNGVSDYVEMGGAGPSLSEIAGDKLTIEAWVKPRKLTGTQYIIQKNGPFFLNLYGNKLQGQIHSPWTIVTGKVSLSLDKWHHVVMSYDGSDINLYVNGKFDNSTPKTGDLAGNGCVQIGQGTAGNCGAGSGHFYGFIDEVRIYKQALLATEIQKHYAEGLEKHEDLAIK